MDVREAAAVLDAARAMSSQHSGLGELRWRLGIGPEGAPQPVTDAIPPAGARGECSVLHVEGYRRQLLVRGLGRRQAGPGEAA